MVHGRGDLGPRGALLGDHHRPGHLVEDHGVHLLEEPDRVEVLPTAVFVGHPLAGLAAVVEVEHGRHGVDTQAVDVELVQPVEGVGDEEVADLVAAVVEDERPPVGVGALAWIGVLVEGRAVEAGERPPVAREVRGDPVDDHADARLVERVDQVAQVVGGAEPGRRGVVAGDLVAPRPTEGVFGDRHQLHVREPRWRTWSTSWWAASRYETPSCPGRHEPRCTS